MIEVKLNSVDIKINGDVKHIPINNMTTSVAFRLSDLSKKRDAIIQSAREGLTDEANNEQSFKLVEDMFSILVYEYDKHKHVIELIPIECLEEFLQECMSAIQGIKKKHSTSTKVESMESKTGSRLKSTGSRKKK